MSDKKASEITCDREEELLNCISKMDAALEVAEKTMLLIGENLDIEKRRSAQLKMNLENQMTINKSLFNLCITLDERCGGYLNKTFGENYLEQFIDEFEKYFSLNSGNDSFNQYNNELVSFVERHRKLR